MNGDDASQKPSVTPTPATGHGKNSGSGPAIPGIGFLTRLSTGFERSSVFRPLRRRDREFQTKDRVRSRPGWLNPAEDRDAAPGNGFTYLSALVFVVIMGIVLGTTGTVWTTVMKREREQQLLFAGNQIRRGIESYYKHTPGGRTPEYPRSFEDMLKDPRSPSLRRHLRQVYPNPMAADGRWKLILDSRGAIKGVFADSKGVPMKKAHFDKGYESFEKAATYSDWKFIHGLNELAVPPSVPGRTPGSTQTPPNTQAPLLK